MNRMTRRDAIRMLGIGAGLSAIPADTFAGAAVQSRAIIRTILEDIPPARLMGPTLMHEHLSMGRADGGPTFYDDVALLADEVRACGRDGVSCIVDTGNAGLGRKIEALRAIATRSGVFIVASGGWYRKVSYPPDVFRKTADQIADDFVQLAKAERWGALGEIGTGTGVPTDADERKVLQAAAKAHVRTGLPIITHTDDGCAKCALDQVDIFEAAGADLRKVVIGHLNDITDEPTAAPIAIARRGANLGFDHSGRPDDPRADEYARTILAVMNAGFTDRICLSSDFANAKYLRKNGGPGIDMILTTIVPNLRRAGVTDATLHAILVENPRRILAFEPK
jgi:phosphotriesterase-related protein